MKAEYILPPNAYKYCESNEIEDTENDKISYLEIEVSRITFVTDKSIKAQPSVVAAAAAAASLYESPRQPKASSLYNPSVGATGVGTVVIAKIIWWGEQKETAASVSISCDACSSSSRSIRKLYGGKQKQRKNLPKKKQQHQHNNHHQTHHNKLRYCVRSRSLALFLEYLRECPSIEIVASSRCKSDVNDHAHDQETSSASGAAHLPLPAPLLRKYAANYINGCNFEFKTKIYALYRNVESSGTSSQVQQQQQLKVGEIQLRFKMLFAAAAANANKAVRIGTATMQQTLSPPTSMPAVLLQDRQLTVNKCAQPGELLSGTVISVVSAVGAPAKVELMEAIKKLDAGLVALFATAGEPKMEQLKKQQQHLKAQVEQMWPDQDIPDEEEHAVCSGQLNKEVTPELFKQVNALQLHMEALTLQAEGTKRMELLQNEVRPIFTVDCQLSDNLINSVPRGHMFHIMQFESEKFQSLTQCTRFGQTQQRQVRLPTLDNGNQEIGSIHFTIWWREPGTCLNEMLGMGSLPLVELYRESLLEQCKCIAIHRRDLHLASLYVKISLRADHHQQLMLSKSLTNGQTPTKSNNNNDQQNMSNNHSEAAAATNNNNNNNSRDALTPPANNNNNNNKAFLESVHFMAETNKVRLLRGYFHAGETRYLSPDNLTDCKELVFQPFWQEKKLTLYKNEAGSFELHEQFSILNDQAFLNHVQRNNLVLDLLPFRGRVVITLAQFFMSYKDDSICDHLCRGSLPVIAIDGWAAVREPETMAKLGELKVLLAIGSEPQIAQLKLVRGFHNVDINPRPITSTTSLFGMLQSALTGSALSGPATTAARKSPIVDKLFKFKMHIVGAAGLPLNSVYSRNAKKQAKKQAAAKRFPPNEPPNSYVTFQAMSCNAPSYRSHEGLVYATTIVHGTTTPQWRCSFDVEVTSDYVTNAQKFFILKVWKKSALATSTSTNMFTPGPTPLEDAIIGFTSLKLTRNELPKGCHNITDFNGRIMGCLELTLEHFVDPAVASTSSVPIPIAGTSAASTSGAVSPAAASIASTSDTSTSDGSSSTPSNPTLSTYLSASSTSSLATLSTSLGSDDGGVDLIDFEESLDVGHLQLGQAIKRKYTELEQISDRLRTRLVDVTDDSLPAPSFDMNAALENWKPDEQQQPSEDDELVADFERALLTPSPPPSTSQEVAVEKIPTAQRQKDAENDSP